MRAKTESVQTDQQFSNQRGLHILNPNGCGFDGLDSIVPQKWVGRMKQLNVQLGLLD